MNGRDYLKIIFCRTNKDEDLKTKTLTTAKNAEEEQKSIFAYIILVFQKRRREILIANATDYVWENVSLSTWKLILDKLRAQTELKIILPSQKWKDNESSRDSAKEMDIECASESRRRWERKTDTTKVTKSFSNGKMQINWICEP